MHEREFPDQSPLPAPASSVAPEWEDEFEDVLRCGAVLDRVGESCACTDSSLTCVGRSRRGLFSFHVYEYRTSRHRSHLVVVEKNTRLPSIDRIQREFSLTRAQVRVALLLAERYTDPEIAGMLNISLHTARNHVRAVRMKVNAQSRREVRAILLKLARERSRGTSPYLRPSKAPNPGGASG
jgi:DNA-binding CsgD family transcriptional regulator